jgi:pyruvate formate lyase activating enzyme
VDHFYFDYKLTDINDHRKYTGKNQSAILDNLDYICNDNARVTLRCPIIPTINDNKDHFMAITELSNAYKNITNVEIMPYHKYGRKKFSEIGRIPYDIKSETVHPDKTKEWIRTLKSMGCSKIKTLD